MNLHSFVSWVVTCLNWKSSNTKWDSFTYRASIRRQWYWMWFKNIQNIWRTTKRKNLNKLGSFERKGRLKKLMKDNYKKNKIFLYNNAIMPRISPSATPLWPLIYGLGIVAFIYFLAVPAGIAIFLIFMIVGVTILCSEFYYNSRQRRTAT